MVNVVDQVVPVKRKRHNKNKKKAWRKKTEITDVEEKLEEERREERFGGPLEEREDEELMFLDLGDDSEKKEVEPVPFAVDTRPGKAVGFKTSTRKRPVKKLRCHQYLNGLLGAKTPHKAKSREDKVNALLKQIQSKSEVAAKKPNLLQRLEEKEKKIKGTKRTVKAKVNNKMTLDWNNDVWNNNSNELVKRCEENGVDEEFVHQIVDYYSTITKTRAFNVPGVRYKPTSSLPSVQIPEAGQSYNPAFEDHQVLLEKAVKQEMKRRSVVAKDRRATTKMFPKVDEAPTEESWLAEMAEGLPKGDGNEEEDSEDEIEGCKVEATVTGKKTSEKKTKKQRKKEVKQKFKEREKLLVKERRVREGNVFRIKTYKKEIREGEKLLKNRKAARKAYWEQKKSKPARLGRVKYEPEDIAVSLGTELRGSLRTAKPVVSLIDERFKNFQRRNLIEPRNPPKHSRTYGLKTYLNKEHKATLAEIEKNAEEDW